MVEVAEEWDEMQFLPASRGPSEAVYTGSVVMPVPSEALDAGSVVVSVPSEGD